MSTRGNLDAPLKTCQDLLEDMGIVIFQRVETISDTDMVELGMILAIIPGSKIGVFWAWIVGRLEYKIHTPYPRAPF